jgi:fucose permease
MKKNMPIVLLVLFIFFIISFLTNILGPLIPDIIDSFHLPIGLAGFLPFSFFAAYGVMSIPAGMLMEKYANKTVIIIGFFLAFTGALLFSLLPAFEIALLSLFAIGIGMAMLQVVINPLLRVAGGEENFAFNSVLAQLFYGAASFVSPMLYSWLVSNIHTASNHPVIRLFDELVSPDLKWVSLYWVFSGISLLSIIAVRCVKFPAVILKAEDRIETGEAFRTLLANKYVILFFFGIFCYVGTEQGIANWISKFLQIYHGADPATTGASIIAYFWGLMTIGCLGGLLLLKIFDSRYVLVGAVICAIISLALALAGSLGVALICFPLTGLFLSVMWSIIVSLGLNSIDRYHGTFAGILCTAIAGGAVVPLMIGGLAEWTGLRTSMTLIFLALGYILSIGIWAKPMVTNATIKNWSELFKF